MSETTLDRLGPISRLRVYLQAENLFWFKSSEFSGPDPERTNNNNIPVPRVLSAGLNITL